jgi:transposase
MLTARYIHPIKQLWLVRGGVVNVGALHVVARTQVRMRSRTGRAYYDKKILEGKKHNEAMRCLKRRLADHVWRVMIADERRRTVVSPGGHLGAASQSCAAGSTPSASSSDKSLPRSTGIDATAPGTAV